MSTATLLARLKRLEQKRTCSPGIAVLLRAARLHRHSMTAEEQAASLAKRDSAALAFFLSGALPKSIAQQVQRSRGKRLAEGER